MKKHIVYIIPLLFCIGCHTQKKVAITESTTAYHSMNGTDSLRIENSGDFAEVSVSNYEELLSQTHNMNNIPRKDEYIYTSIKKTERTQEALLNYRKSGEMRKRIDKLMQILSESHAQQIKEQNLIRMFITYYIPLDNVSQMKIVKVRVINLSPDISKVEAKALFDFAESIPFEFEYSQYKDYTTGSIALMVPCYCKIE